MRRNPVLFFWGSAALVAAVFAVAAPLALPYETLGLVAEADRERARLLTVFTGGAMALLLGASSLLGGRRMVTLRDVEEAGGVRQAVERERIAANEEREYTGNFGVWMVAMGAFLLVIYFALWGVLG